MLRASCPKSSALNILFSHGSEAAGIRRSSAALVSNAQILHPLFGMAHEAFDAERVTEHCQ
jgi:hypothetical protein